MDKIKPKAIVIGAGLIVLILIGYFLIQDDGPISAGDSTTQLKGMYEKPNH